MGGGAGVSDKQGNSEQAGPDSHQDLVGLAQTQEGESEPQEKEEVGRAFHTATSPLGRLSFIHTTLASNEILEGTAHAPTRDLRQIVSP